MDWITENWEEIVAAVGAVVIAARIIVKLTPTPADDAWFAKVIDFLKHIGLHIGGSGGASVLLAVALVGLSGCGLPQAMVETVHFERVQIAGDKGLLNQLFDGRRAANERLMAAVDEGIQLSILRREREAAAWAAAHPDGKPLNDKDKQPLLTSVWIIETMHGAGIAKQVLRDRIDSDERARAIALANLDDRDRVLADAGKLVIRSQQWSVETQSLVQDLMAKALKTSPPAPVVPPLVESPEIAPGPAAPPAGAAPMK
jgi:hypothetical protein